MPTLQTLRCPSCRSEIALVRGTKKVRCISCGSTSAIRHEESGETWLEHLPDGRKDEKAEQGPSAAMSATLVILLAVGCTGLVNMAVLGKGRFGTQPGQGLGEKEGGEPSDRPPDDQDQPVQVAFDPDLPPLVLPEAGGIIVAQVSAANPDAKVGDALMVAIDPETQKKLWEIPEIRSNSAVGWVNTANHIVTLDEVGTIVIVNAKNGEKTQINSDKGRPQNLCKTDNPDEVILEVRGGVNKRINTSKGTAVDLEAAHPCSGRAKPVEACREKGGGLTRKAQCARPSAAPPNSEIEGEYALTNDERGVLVGRDASSKTKIILMGFNPEGGDPTWTTELQRDDSPLTEHSSAEFSNGIFYLTARSPGQPWELIAVDGNSGEQLWNTPFENTEESPMDRGISIVDDTVFVLDDSALHRVDANTGDLLADLNAALAGDETEP